MNKLIEWQTSSRKNQFIVRANGGHETRYKLILWIQGECAEREGFPGEGYGETIDAAFEMAHSNLVNQKAVNRKTTQQWYLPIGVELWLRHIFSDLDNQLDALDKFREGVEVIR